MIKAYVIYYRVYVDDVNVGSHNTGLILGEEAEVEFGSREIFINWDNLDENIEILRIAADQKTIEQKKKGRAIYLGHWDSFLLTVRREWKDELNIRIKITTEEASASLNDIMRYRDIDKAIQYIKDRGLSVCPIAK